MTTTTDRQDFQRALEMERNMLAAAAQRGELHPLGLMSFDDARPRVWVHNQLHVTGPAGDIDDLVRVLDEHYGHLEHRRAVIEDEVEGERLAGGFRARGWQVETTVYMALREARDRDPDRTLAEEVDAPQQREVEFQVLREDPVARDPEVRDMLLSARAAGHSVADECRFVAGVADGRQVGSATVYRKGKLVQVEDVATLQAFRRRGVARAMVSLAIDLAEESDPDLVWIAADDDDWPKDLYFKLGFRPIGRIVSFTRVGPEHPAYDPATR